MLDLDGLKPDHNYLRKSKSKESLYRIAQDEVKSDENVLSIAAHGEPEKIREKYEDSKGKKRERVYTADKKSVEKFWEKISKVSGKNPGYVIWLYACGTGHVFEEDNFAQVLADVSGHDVVAPTTQIHWERDGKGKTSYHLENDEETGEPGRWERYHRRVEDKGKQSYSREAPDRRSR